VVGTGVAGAATGFALARRGAAVAFVEAGLAGRATAAGAGIIQPWSSTVGGDFYKLYAAGADYYPEAVALLAEAGVQDSGYHRAGALVVNRDPAVIDAAEERVSARAAAAATIGEVRRISGAEARELFPPLADGFDALHLRGGARVDGRRLREALLSGAQAHGAELVEGTAILTERGDVKVEGRSLPADAVVVAAGAWTDRVLAPLGTRVGVEPQRGQLVHLRLEGVETRDWPSVHPVAPHYLVAFDAGRVVAGATRETGSGFDPRETAAGLNQVLADALSVAPGLADATVIETRVGLRPLAEGESEGPVFGPVPGHDGVFVNAGFGAAGLTMGPLVGDLLARRVLGEAGVPGAPGA
jgi:D-amino-acid dehydrogenase